MFLTDTHSHIYATEFETDRAEMLKRARQEGVENILLPAIDSGSHEAMLRLERSFPDTCISMMGVHPCSIKEDFEKELHIARQYLEQRKFIAVGEIGLDFYWDKTFTDQQYQAFHTQIKWALEFDIPVVIHSRNSTDECINVVQQYRQQKLRGVFHCFSGNEEQAQKITDMGFYLGIGGVLTFKNSGLEKVVQAVDIKHLVLETDAPYLAPVPFRGKRNEPAYLRYVVEKIADIKNIIPAEIATITTANAKLLFKF